MKDTLYLKNYLNMLDKIRGKLIKMGEFSKITYDDFLGYGEWCKFVIRTLETL
jgi:hypothetical protein